MTCLHQLELSKISAAMFTFGGNGSDISRLSHPPSLDSVFRHEISMLLTSESRNGMKRAAGDSDSGSRYASTLASPTSSTSTHEHDSLIPTIDHRCTNAFECITPLTKSQQLKILLARNYSSAPACMLSFVDDVLVADSVQIAAKSKNTNEAGTSTGTLVDIAVTDANDGARDSADTLTDGNGSNATLDNTRLANETDASSNRTSFICSEDDAPHKIHGNYSQCNDNAQGYSRQKIDAGTSPLQQEQFKKSLNTRSNNESVSANDWFGEREEKAKSEDGAKDGTLVEGGSAHYAEMRVNSMLALCTGTNVSNRTNDGVTVNCKYAVECNDNGEDENHKGIITNSTSADSGITASPNDSLKSAETKALPVYCRSLLYRIRVPLWQRLKNGCNVDDGKCVINTPGLSITRTNLSCHRSREYMTGLSSVGSAGKVASLGSSSNSSTATSENSPSLKLTMSDLDTESTDDEGSPCFSFFKNPGNFTLCTTAGVSTRVTKIKASYGIVMGGKKWLPGKLMMLGTKDLNVI